MIEEWAHPSGKIKVLRIIARLNVGGPAIHVVLLNSGLNKKRFSSYLVTGVVAKGERDVAYIAREKGVEPLVIPEFKRDIWLPDDFKALIKLYKLMKRLKPDIVHTHTAKAGTLGRIAAIMNRVPVKIHTFHGHVFHSYFSRLKSAFFVLVEKILAHFTDKIVVISRSQFIDVKDTYKIAPGNKCSVIPLGLELEPFLMKEEFKDLRDMLKIGKDTLLVGIVGRLVKVKNHRMFLDVVKRIKDTAPDIKVKFLVIGDGVLKSVLERYARKLDIEPSLVFMGWQTDLASIYRCLDVVCLTSLNEGTPISLIEAMASGRPIVATDVGGVRDIVAHNSFGLLSPSRDVDTFAKNLLKLLCDKKRRIKMGEEGKAFVIREYPKERLFREIEKLYEQEIACSAGGRR